MLQALVLMAFWSPLALCGSITLEKSPTPAILGHPFTFSCHVNGDGETRLILFQIMKNDSYAPVCHVDVDTGNQITSNNSYLCFREEELPLHTYSLTIRKLSKRDRSRWMCQSAGMRSNTLHLDVKYPPSLDVRPVQPCSGYTFFLNQNASLNCSVTAANPPPSNFTWYHGGNAVGRDQIYTIPTVYKSSSGLYRCVADNGIFPPGEDIVTVEVHSPPVVHIDEIQSVVNVSDDLIIHCKADAYPEVTSVVWTKKVVNARISDNGTLYLRNIQENDAGDYYCTATNNVTSCSGKQLSKMSSAPLKLVVQYAPDILSFDVKSGGMSSLVWTEHDNVTLQCQVNSNPASVIEIRNSTSSLGRGTSGGILDASIDDVGCLQTGPYTCSAGNMLGQAEEQNISLQVKCAPRSYGSTTNGYEFRSVLSGNVTLQLTVIAFPEPTFTWSRTPNSRPLNNSKVITDGVRVTGSVTIFGVKEEDFRNYTVKVSNTEGTLSKNVTLISASMPDTPMDLQASSISVRSFTLKWEKGSNGGAKQRFNIQYRQPGGQWTTHPTSPTEEDVLQLDIDDLQPGTVYDIRINAQNEHGASDYTDTIVVVTESVNYGLIAATATAVIVAILVGIIITIVLVKRNRKRAQQDVPGNKRQEVEEIVMEDNLLYESSGDLGRPLVMEHNDLYTEINAISKTNNPVEDVYAKPQKENRPDEIKVQNDTAADIYAKPQKKEKGKPNGLVTEKKGGTLKLTSSGQYAVLGREFSFTCTVIDATVAGLITFKRGDNQSFPTVCSVDVETGNRVSGEKEFLCSAVDGQANTYSLTIRNVSRNDSTVWQCQGGGMKSNNVTLNVKYPPTVAIHAVTPCSGFTFLVNEINVALKCSVKGANPAPTAFTWYHGDVFLQNGPSPIYTLGRVNRSSEGQYKCTADNGISPPGQANVTVDVHYPPTVHVDDTKRSVRESEDLTIQCTAEANPEVTSVVWTKGSVNARISDSRTLHLRNIQRKDAGVYVCKATNNVTSCSGRRQTESSTGTVTLEVRYPPTVAIHAVTPCSGFTFLVNEINVALNCSVTGANPAPTTFTWYHGDAIMQNGPKPIYTLGRVNRSSEGQYRCTADNGISPPGQANVTVDVHYPPTVHVDDTKRVVRESEDLTIQCTAEANPNVTSVVWTKEGVGGRISNNGSLQLSNIQKAAAGVYVCTATNNVTSCSGRHQTRNSSGTVTLEVQYAPRVERFGVTSGNGTTTVKEHDNVTLLCNVTGNPASSIEIRNTTSSIESGKTSKRDRQTLTTMLLNVSCLEGGNYTCAASNSIGEASQTVLLQVRCVPRRHSSSPEKLVFTSGLHENVTLSLTVIAFPQPTFTWSKMPNARQINTTEVTTEGVLVKGSVTIFDVKEEDYINYTVSVNNAEGKLDLQIPLVSKSRPHLPSTLKVVNIRPRSVTLRWEKAFNGGAKQRFNVQYRQPGGQWTTHPTSPTEEDALQLDIDDLQPGTVYEIRINAQNEYGTSNYTSAIETTDTDPTNITIIACVMAVVFGAIVLTVVVVVKKWRNKQKGQSSSTADQGEEDEGRVVADNDLYETSADLNLTPAGTGAGVCDNDVYAVVNKPAKKNDPVEDLYAMPRKEKKKKNGGKTKKKLEDQTEDIYAQPEKKKGKMKGRSKKEGLGAEHSGGAAGDEKKEGQKTGIDEDGLLYVSVDFSGLPPASDTIKRSDEETEYVGIDFAASAVKKE